MKDLFLDLKNKAGVKAENIAGITTYTWHENGLFFQVNEPRTESGKVIAEDWSTIPLGFCKKCKNHMTAYYQRFYAPSGISRIEYSYRCGFCKDCAKEITEHARKVDAKNYEEHKAVKEYRERIKGEPAPREITVNADGTIFIKHPETFGKSLIKK